MFEFSIDLSALEKCQRRENNIVPSAASFIEYFYESCRDNFISFAMGRNMSITLNLELVKNNVTYTFTSESYHLKETMTEYELGEWFHRARINVLDKLTNDETNSNFDKWNKVYITCDRF